MIFHGSVVLAIGKFDIVTIIFLLVKPLVFNLSAASSCCDESFCILFRNFYIRYKYILFRFSILCFHCGLHQIYLSGVIGNIIYPKVTASIIVGCFAIIYVRELYTGNYNYELGFIISVGAVLAFIIKRVYSIRHKKKHGSIPSSDERHVLITQKYLLFMLYLILFVSGIFFIILYVLGITAIKIKFLLIYMLIIFVIISLGTVIIKKM